jgi:Flp pilus assembly protein TadG
MVFEALLKRGKAMNVKWHAAVRRLNQKGQSMVEIAIMAPLIMVALYIPADFGIAFYTAHLTENAVREAARIGTGLAAPFGSSEENQVRNETLNRLPARLTSPTVTVRFLDTGAAACMQVVEVTAMGNYNFFLYQLVRLLGLSAPDTMTITRSVQMRYNYQSNSNNQPCTAT